jgi:hypothetical protein
MFLMIDFKFSSHVEENIKTVCTNVLRNQSDALHASIARVGGKGLGPSGENRSHGDAHKTLDREHKDP